MEPDRLEKGIRFGCGSLTGALIALGSIFGIALDSMGLAVVVIGLAALVCGLLAVRYGDRFFEEALRWWRW